MRTILTILLLGLTNYGGGVVGGDEFKYRVEKVNNQGFLCFVLRANGFAAIVQYETPTGFANASINLNDGFTLNSRSHCPEKPLQGGSSAANKKYEQTLAVVDFSFKGTDGFSFEMLFEDTTNIPTLLSLKLTYIANIDTFPGIAHPSDTPKVIDLPSINKPIGVPDSSHALRCRANVIYPMSDIFWLHVSDFLAQPFNVPGGKNDTGPEMYCPEDTPTTSTKKPQTTTPSPSASSTISFDLDACGKINFKTSLKVQYYNHTAKTKSYATHMIHIQELITYTKTCDPQSAELNLEFFDASDPWFLVFSFDGSSGSYTLSSVSLNYNPKSLPDADPSSKPFAAKSTDALGLFKSPKSRCYYCHVSQQTDVVASDIAPILTSQIIFEEVTMQLFKTGVDLKK